MPRINSPPRTGVAMSCSIVPRSHSRATVSEVNSAAMTIMMTAISPGTMKFFDSRSALNQTRGRTSRGVCTRGPARALELPHRHGQRILRHQRLGVADGQRGGVGVAAVDEELHRRRPAGGHVLGEGAGNDQAGQHVAAVDRADHLPIVAGVAPHREIAASRRSGSPGRGSPACRFESHTISGTLSTSSVNA